MRQASNYIPREILDNICAQNDIAEVISECGVLLKLLAKPTKGFAPSTTRKLPPLTSPPKSRRFTVLGVMPVAMSLASSENMTASLLWKRWNGCQSAQVFRCQPKMEKHAD